MPNRLLRAILVDANGNTVGRHPVLITDGEDHPLAALQSGDGGFLSVRLNFIDEGPEIFLRLAGVDFTSASDVSSLVSDGADEAQGAVPFVLVTRPASGNLTRNVLPTEIGFRSDVEHYEMAAAVSSLACEPLVANRAPARRFRFRNLVSKPGVRDGELRVLQEHVGRVTYRLGAALEFETVWTPIDQVLGEPVHSLSLAPCEQTRIAVINWSRDEEGRLREASRIDESLVQDLFRDRLIEEVMTASIDEWQSGDSLQGGMAGVIGGSYFGGMLSFTNSHSGGYAESATEGHRDIAADGTQRIHDAVTQMASTARSRNGTVVKDATQAELAFAQTRVVRNHNHCHMLNILYHQVLQRCEIRTRFLRAYDVILVDFGLKVFEDPFTYSPDIHRLLAEVGLEESVTRVPSEEIVARRRDIERYLLEPSLSECIDALERVLCLSVQARSGRRANALEAAEVGSMDFVVDAGEGARDSFALRLSLRTTWGDEVEFIFTEETAPDPRFVGQLWSFEVSTGSRVRGRTGVPGSRLRWSDIAFVQVIATTGDLGAPVIDFIEFEALLEGRRWSPFGRIAPGEPVEPPQRTVTGHSVWRFRPAPIVVRTDRPELDAAPEDICCIDKLIRHLNYNKSHYTAALLASMSAHERAYFLKLFWFSSAMIGAVGGDVVEGRLFDFVENRVVGVMDSVLVFPLRNADSFARSLEIEGEYEPRTTIALPTRGVQAVGQLGSCNLCEKIDPSRFWRWDTAPCPDDATEILPVSVESRYQDPGLVSAPAAEGRLEPQTPPEAPSSSFLDKLLEVLGTPDIFRDLSGKEELAALLGEMVRGAAEVEKARLASAGAASGAGAGGGRSQTAAPREGGAAEGPGSIRGTDDTGTGEDLGSYIGSIRGSGLPSETQDELVEDAVRETNRRRGGTGEQPSPVPTTEDSAPSGPTEGIPFLLRARYSDGNPLYGIFEFRTNVIGDIASAIVWEIDVNPDGNSTSTVLAISEFGPYEINGALRLKYIPSSLNVVLRKELPGTIPDIAIPFARFYSSELSAGIATTSYHVDPGTRYLVLDAIAQLEDHEITFTVNISSSLRAGAAGEEQISNEITAEIEATLRRIIGVSLAQRLGLAGTLGLEVDGEFRAGGTVNGKITFQRVRAVVLQQDVSF